MLRMPEFQVHRPATAAEAVRARAELDGALYVAGGTDLVPNLKHELHTPRHLVAIGHLDELVGIEQRDDGGLSIGAGTTLHQVATSDPIASTVPALAKAAGLIAGPQHRRMGTLGGNVMLDTRCLFYNQSRPWREALGYCLKKDGDWCHVIGSKNTCVAAQSSDTVPVLLALDAELELLTPQGPLRVPLAKLFKQDGRFERIHDVEDGSLLCRIHIPPPSPGHRSTYRKVRAREAVDFPQLGIAVVAGFEGDKVQSLTAVVGALLPKPKVLRGTDRAVGTTLDDATIDALAQAAHKQTRPQGNIHGDPAWRRHLARVEMRRALLEIRDG